MPHSPQRRRGHPADGGDLEPGERPGVEAELLELLPDRPDGVHRGEPDPLVAAGDQALDRLLDLVRRARRLDRDRRDDLGGRAVLDEPGDHRAGLLLRPRHEDPPAEQRLGLEPGRRLAQPGGLAPTTATTGPVEPGRGHRGRDLGEGARDGPLVRSSCPSAVTATGVAGSRPAASRPGRGLDDVVDRPPGRRRWRPGPACRVQSTSAPCGWTTWTPTRCPPGSAGPRRRPGRRSPRTRPGTTSKADALLAAGGDLLGEPGERGGVAVHEPDDAPAALGRADDELGAGGAGHRLAVLAEAGVDAPRRPARHVVGERAAPGRAGRATTTSASASRSTARSVSRPSSPGPAPTNDDLPERGGVLRVRVELTGHLLLPVVRVCASSDGRRRTVPVAVVQGRPLRPAAGTSSAAPSSTSSVARAAVPELLSGSPTEAGRRRGGASRRRRRRRRRPAATAPSPSSPSTTSANAPSGAAHPASSAASSARSAVDGGPGRRVVERRPARRARPSSRRPGTRRRARPGRGRAA